MERTSPHYDQQFIGSCQAFGVGRCMRKLFDRVFSYLPRGVVKDIPLLLLHMKRDVLSRKQYQGIYLLILMDYYYIHLSQFLKSRTYGYEEPFTYMIKCHNKGYQIPSVSTVFKGKGSKRENDLLANMLRVVSRFKIEVYEQHPRSIEGIDDLIRNVELHIPALVGIVGGDDGHIVECIGYDEPNFTFRNAYATEETFMVTRQKMKDGQDFVMGGHEYSFHKIWLFKMSDDGETYHEMPTFLDRIPEFKDKYDTAKQDLERLVATFLEQPPSDLLVDAPSCSISEPSGVRVCVHMQRIMSLIYDYNEDVVDKLLKRFQILMNARRSKASQASQAGPSHASQAGPSQASQAGPSQASKERCPSLDEWYKILEASKIYNGKNPKNQIISDEELEDLGTVLNIVSHNEIYGHFHLTRRQRDYLAKTNIRMFARIFPDEHSYIKGDSDYEDIDTWDINKYLDGRADAEHADALTQMLDIIERETPYKLVECLKDIILQNDPDAAPKSKSKSSESIDLNSSDEREHDEFNKTYKRSRFSKKRSKTKKK